MTHVERVRLALAQGPGSMKELVARTGLSYSQIHGAINTLEGRGEVGQMPRRYHLRELLETTERLVVSLSASGGGVGAT